MDEGMVGLLMLIFISVGVAALTHALWQCFFRASIVSGLISAGVFQIIVFLHQGYLDPFILIAVPISLLFTTGISFVVGIPFRIVRRKAKTPPPPPMSEQGEANP